MLTYEQAHRRMYVRIVRNAFFGVVLVAASLSLGTYGYHRFVHLAWMDAFMNATMILTTMGPVDRPESDGGKLFASLFALYSGVVFVTVPSLVVLPVAQRILHRLHFTATSGVPVS